MSLLSCLGMVTKQNKGEIGAPCSALLPKHPLSGAAPRPWIVAGSAPDGVTDSFSRAAEQLHPPWGAGHRGHAGRVLLAARDRHLPAGAEMCG